VICEDQSVADLHVLSVTSHRKEQRVISVKDNDRFFRGAIHAGVAVATEHENGHHEE